MNRKFFSLNTQPTGSSSATNKTRSPPGTYSIIATTGYGTAQQCISNPVQAILQEMSGNIAIFAIPPGGRIYYDGNDTGMNASAIIADVVPNVSHSVRITLPGYQDYDPGPIIVSHGEMIPVYVIMTPITPPTGVGNLNVTSIPDGVEFCLYTEECDMAPVTLYDIPAGINAYEAGLEEYNGAMGSFVIKDGETTDLNIPLQPYTSDMGVVAIESIPMGADIYIDGSPINTKTSFMTLMSSGLHTYELRLPGYQNKSGSFTVVTGYDMPAIVSETLQPVSEIGMAVMLIGGAAVGMMLMARK